MAQRKTAKLVAAEQLSPEVRLLELESDEPLGFVGGQYLIVDSGVLLPSGKAAKRAYSIITSDEHQHRVQIAVKRVGDGPASSFLHALPIGGEVPFSGPWGKFLPDDARPRRTLIIASDTGITAALGLVRGQSFAPHRELTTLLWLVERHDYFLPPSLVRDWCGLPMHVERILPVGHPERVQACLANQHIDAHLSIDAAHRAETLFLCGDGALVHPLRERFGIENTRIECFFNNPEKKST